MKSTYKKLSKQLEEKGEVLFNGKNYTVEIFENSDSDFEYNLYPLGTKADSDGEINCDFLIDGGIFESYESFEIIEDLYNADKFR